MAFCRIAFMKTTALIALCVVLLPTALSPAADPVYVLHEWGTFTTLIGSDGTHLNGVHLEDAPLPDFVYELDDINDLRRQLAQPENHRFTKGRTITPERSIVGVNVRLETPVLYFYTDDTFDAQVDVGFTGGSIGQWFPQRSHGEPPAPSGRLDFNQPRTGSIQWKVRVEPAGEGAAARIFRSGELPCWLYPRYPDSALVTNAQNETEKYLFYRGLGHIDLPITFTATDSVLTARNTSDADVRRWLVFDLNTSGQARWWVRDALNAGDAAASVEFDSQPYRKDWKKDLYQAGQKMLTDAGLYRDEADAMLQTWWPGYFETPGLRVFWIVPRSQIDEILPLKVTPEPQAIERVIVGRAEILKPSFEKELVKEFAAASDKRPNRWRSDRFYPAYASRVRQLNSQVREDRSLATSGAADVKAATPDNTN